MRPKEPGPTSDCHRPSGPLQNPRRTLEMREGSGTRDKCQCCRGASCGQHRGIRLVHAITDCYARVLSFLYLFRRTYHTYLWSCGPLVPRVLAACTSCFVLDTWYRITALRGRTAIISSPSTRRKGFAWASWSFAANSFSLLATAAINHRAQGDYFRWWGKAAHRSSTSRSATDSGTEQKHRTG